MAVKTAILMVADTEAEVPTNLPTGTVCIAIDTSKIVRSNVVWSIGGSSGGAHTHPESEVTNLGTDLAGKAATAHTHTEANVTNLVSDLAAKAATSHTHAESDTTNLTTDLAAKATAGSALTESTEASSTPVAGATLTALGSGVRVFAFFTLPTTEKWYVITGIEWKNGGTVNGNVWCGVERVDANPPVLPGTVNVATGARLVQTTINAVQRNSQIASQAIRGGTILGVWFVSDSALGTFGNTAVTSANNRKTLAAGAPALADVTAWTASTAAYSVKAYWQGIK